MISSPITYKVPSDPGTGETANNPAPTFPKCPLKTFGILKIYPEAQPEERRTKAEGRINKVPPHILIAAPLYVKAIVRNSTTAIRQSTIAVGRTTGGGTYPVLMEGVST